MDIKEQRRERFEKQLIKDNPGAVTILHRKADGSYFNRYVQSAWDGWNSALDSVVIEPVEKFGEPKPYSYDHCGSDPKYLADKAEFEANQARDALWIAAIEAAGLQVKS